MKGTLLGLQLRAGLRPASKGNAVADWVAPPAQFIGVWHTLPHSARFRLVRIVFSVFARCHHETEVTEATVPDCGPGLTERTERPILYVLTILAYDAPV